ncbi:MAG: GNAT family N-acetyltransferase [Pseudoxanthomonas sp.]
MTPAELETERLRLLRMSPDSAADADFTLSLLNDPDFVRAIADRGVRSRDDARAYLRERVVPAYAQGWGMLRVELKASGESIGNCGLVRREGLDGPDLGYAFLPAGRGRGYALEAARAVLEEARERGIGRMLAIVNPDNAASIALLQTLRFGFDRMIVLPGIDHALRLYSLPLE